MPTFRTGDAAPRMMVLGLVVQQPDTIAGVARRLSDEFASARFARSAAHGSLPSLAEQGLVRRIEAGPPGQPTRDRFEATEEGRKHFLEWLHCSELPLIVRDVLQCKLEFMQRDDLGLLLRRVRDLEEFSTTVCDTARARVLKEQRSRRARSEPVDWRVKLRGIRSRDEANIWSMMSLRLEQLGEELEQLINEVSSGTVV